MLLYFMASIYKRIENEFLFFKQLDNNAVILRICVIAGCIVYLFTYISGQS